MSQLTMRLAASHLWSTLILPATLMAQSQAPYSLFCQSNAKTMRDFAFELTMQESWSGVIPSDPNKPFGVITDRGQSAMDNIPPDSATYGLADKVFSSLNTNTPVIRSITRDGSGMDKTSEFRASVVSRSQEALFIVWTNTFGNKVWSAVIDPEHRKAVVTQVFLGATSIGFEAETLDCK